MNEQARYFGMSVGGHGLLVLLLLVLTAGDIVRKDTVTIDFSLDNTTPLCAPQTLQKTNPSPAVCPPVPLKQTVERMVTPEPVVSSTPEPAEPPLQPAAAAVQAVSQTAGKKVENSVASAGSPASVVSMRPAVAASSSYNPIGDTGPEQVKKRYLKEHFNYIRELIIKRLVYPAMARRMEWSGKVVLAFVVGEDGGVRSIQVKESSGFPLLDKSAVDTVRNVAPFPRPPVAAEIVMPVNFLLK